MSGPAPASIRIVYLDRNGAETLRDVVVVQEDESRIEGYCLLRQEPRTFFKARVVSAAPTPVDDPIEPQPRPRRPWRPRSPKPNYRSEICFTGFASSDRDALEDLAASNRILVHHSVTKNLEFLCCGPNAGPAKLAKANAAGVTLLTKDEFLHLIETGELPD